MKAPVPDLEPLPFDDRHACFGCGARNRTGLGLRFFLEPEAQVLATLRLPKRFQGSHGFGHGGVIAAMLDEAMSKAILAAAHGQQVRALTRRLETEYLRPTPLGATLTLRGRQDRVEGRKHFCSATLSDAEGQILARGGALFITIERRPEGKR